MHADMAALTVQSNRQLRVTEAILQKKANELFGKPNIY